MTENSHQVDNIHNDKPYHYLVESKTFIHNNIHGTPKRFEKCILSEDISKVLLHNLARHTTVVAGNCYVVMDRITATAVV